MDSLPAAHQDASPNRHARLEAAIALLRSEAFASGYVVEEVRLGLPAQDINVTPRIVIPHHPAGVSPAILNPPLQNQHQLHPTPVPRSTEISLTSGSISSMPSCSVHTIPCATAPQSSISGRCKRTISGSVLMRTPCVPTTAPASTSAPTSTVKATVPIFESKPMAQLSKLTNIQAPSSTQNFLIEPPASSPSPKTFKDRHLPSSTTFSDRTSHFWNAFPSIDKGKSMLKATENFHNFQQYANNASRNKIGILPETPEKCCSALVNAKPMNVFLQDEGANDAMVEPISQIHDDCKEDGEKHMNKNININDANDNFEKSPNNTLEAGEVQLQKKCALTDIPESHVRLFLSSVAIIGAREFENSKGNTEGKPSVQPDRVTPEKRREKENFETGKEEEKAETTQRFSKNLTLEPNEKHGNESHEEDQELLQEASIRKSRLQSRLEGSVTSKPRTSSATRPFQCQICPSSFDRDGHLRVHILAVHEKKRPFVCQQCHASFGHSSSLLRHVRTVHQTKNPTRAGRIVTHLRSTRRQQKHELNILASNNGPNDPLKNENGPFRCDICNNSFQRIAILNRHVANAHRSQLSAESAEDEDEDEMNESRES